VGEKNQELLIDYFIQGRPNNCSMIYLTQSYYGCPKSVVFVQECKVVFRKVFLQGGLERRTLCPVSGDPGTSLSSNSKIKVGPFSFM